MQLTRFIYLFIYLFFSPLFLGMREKWRILFSIETKYNSPPTTAPYKKKGKTIAMDEKKKKKKMKEVLPRVEDPYHTSSMMITAEEQVLDIFLKFWLTPSALSLHHDKYLSHLS